MRLKISVFSIYQDKNPIFFAYYLPYVICLTEIILFFIFNKNTIDNL